MERVGSARALTIGEVAARAGMTASRVRYYEGATARPRDVPRSAVGHRLTSNLVEVAL